MALRALRALALALAYLGKSAVRAIECSAACGTSFSRFRINPWGGVTPPRPCIVVDRRQIRVSGRNRAEVGPTHGRFISLID